MPRVDSINTSMKAHHVSLLSRWSAVPGSTVHNPLLESVCFLTQALAPTYSISNSFRCVRLYQENAHKVVTQLLEMVVWLFCSANCPGRLVRGMTFIYNSHRDIWCASMDKFFAQSLRLLMWVISTCFFLLGVRVQALQGKRKRRRAHTMSKALSLLIKLFLKGPANLADECEVMQFIRFWEMQLIVIFGVQLWNRTQLFIGWQRKQSHILGAAI